MAAEMQRDDWFRIKKIPLLIGGATTSRVHTAVKIAPHYEGPVVYVPDASRSVGVCTELLCDERAASYIAELKADYAKRARAARRQEGHAAGHAGRGARQQDADRLGRPTRRRSRSSSAGACSATTTWPSWPQCIDWGPFFQTWDLAGRFPDILRDEVVGDEAQRVFSDGKRLLQRLIEGRWLQANGVIALLPANTVDDDTIEIYTDEIAQRGGAALVAAAPADRAAGDRRREAAEPLPGRLHRAQGREARLHRPVRRHRRPRRGEEGEAVHRRPRRLLAIMLKALADRLAEAFAERLHQRVRTELWGYAPDEALGTEELIAEKYRGIRPAPGYPACPDHSVKRDMFRVLQAEDIGMGLTESLAMTPAASVSGFYLAHPEATYFNVGRIGDDQVDDWARAPGHRPGAWRGATWRRRCNTLCKRFRRVGV